MKKVNDTEKYTIDIDSDAYHCLPKFEINNVGTLLVLKKNVVVGTITDGDIRKALIKNRLLSIPVKNIMNSDYRFGLDVEGCKKIFDKHPYIFMVPMVTDEKLLVEIFLRDI